MRQAAAAALGQIGDTRALKPLVGALHDQSSDVGQAAAEALGQIGDPRALPHLERVAREDEGEAFLLGKMADAARKAMERIRAAQ